MYAVVRLEELDFLFFFLVILNCAPLFNVGFLSHSSFVCVWLFAWVFFKSPYEMWDYRMGFILFSLGLKRLLRSGSLLKFMLVWDK
jgi:hypothetical protein